MRTIFFFTLLLSLSAHAKEDLASCFGNPELQKKYSARLQELVAEDQADREGSPDSVQWKKVTPRDLQRRVEVGKIFGLGCFATAADYAAGAMVYQHGDTADHAFQAFVWSKRGVDLGDASQKWLLAAALDRYLVRMGQKQLFAMQYAKHNNDPCWCLDPVEKSFPDKLRIQYSGKSLAQAIAGLNDLNRGKLECARVKYCAVERKATPKGSVPGFW